MANLPERGAISDNSLEIIDDGGVVIEDGKITKVGDFLSLSKNNLDVREIIKSKQFKEQKNYYDPHQAEQEFRDMFQSYGLYSDADGWIDYLKKTRGSSANAIDSFQLRELGKKLSDTFENFKQKHNIK